MNLIFFIFYFFYVEHQYHATEFCLFSNGDCVYFSPPKLIK